MKIIFLITLVLPISSWALLIDKEVKVEVNAGHETSSDATFTKRSGGGSFDFVGQIKKGILGGAGRASAALVSGSSGSSSSHNKPEETVHGNSLSDAWSLKKTVLNTIFQAVKAITGGVTAIKGQLIKGSGYALSASGSLIAASGDKITDVGKGIVNSAKFAPAGHAVSASVVHHPGPYVVSSGHGSSHGSSGHGESGPSYDIPIGHANYGPPPKSPPHFTSTSNYLPPGTYTTGLHYGPSSFESSPNAYLPVEVPYYRITHTHHHHDKNAIRHKYFLYPDKYKTHHYADYAEYEHPYVYRKYPERFKYFPSYSGPPPFPIDRKGDTMSMALKEIMQFLPKQETNKLTATYNAAPNRHKLVDQYDIPSDPVPSFNTFKVGPISSITRTHTITTAFGNPLHTFQKHLPEPLAHNSLDQHATMHNNFGNPHHSYNAYRSLMMKNKNRMGGDNPNFISNPPNPMYTPQSNNPMKHEPWRVSLNGPTALPLVSSRNSQSTSLTQPPSPPSAHQQLPSEMPFESLSSITPLPYISAPPPSPPLDLDAIIAKLQAKKKVTTSQSVSNSNPNTDKIRTDRQFPVKDSNGQQQGSGVEVQKSVEYQISDPNSFNRELLYF